MRILIVNRALGTLYGGGESFDRHAASFLSQRGHRVTVITGRPLFHGKLEYPELDVVYLRVPNLRRYAYSLGKQRIALRLSALFYHLDNMLFEQRVLRWLAHNRQHENFDVVQTCSLFYLPSQILSRWGIPTVSWLPGPPSKMARKAILRLSSQSHFTIFTHGAPVSALRSLGRTEGIDFFVVPPGIQLNLADQMRRLVNKDEELIRLGIPAKALIGITVSRLVPVKNLNFLLEGIARAREWYWLIIGDGPERKRLSDTVDKLGISDRVRLLGFRPAKEVHRLLAISDVFALTSRYESFSIAVLEAMAHYLPVVATRVGYVRNLVRESKGGILVPLDDVRAFADVLGKLAANSTWRMRLGNSARQYAEKFDWSMIVQKLEKVYEYVARE